MYPKHVAIVGAAGNLGTGILQECIQHGVRVTAIVRSRPERIATADLPAGSRVAVVTSLADVSALTEAFGGCEAVLFATGVTGTSSDATALLSRNMAAVEEALKASGVDRVLVSSSLLASAVGEPSSFLINAFSWLPGKMGAGAMEFKAVSAALGEGTWKELKWTLVRAACYPSGAEEDAVAAENWNAGLNSYMPVSFKAMGRWMLQEAAESHFIRLSPLVSRKK
ncbi:hypothetical protein BC830DRAFT_1165906 [Chytriomyces sp. MP71]|nr:hypothetical protein BC830DRAFT_1165906 [Chytriomyces sp. MP71]